jgi:CheY-like chemotaxis protein
MTLPSESAYPIADFNKMLSDAKIDLSPIELAEILWLAVQRTEGRAIERLGLPINLPEETPNDLFSTPSSKVHSEPETKADGEKADIVLESPKSQGDTQKATTPIPVKIPEAVALRNRREISKALRPLMRKVPSRIRQAIAEEETAIRIAEAQIWSPVVKPEPERWLELAIVIEVTSLYDVWHDTIAEFQYLMERHGAFRDVRTWQLQTSGNTKPQLFLQTATGLNRKPRSPKELLDAGRRRLILFLSDCTSRAWRSGEIFKLLELWSRENPVTIAQLLPERHWDRSALRSGSLVALRSQLSGALSREWVAEGLSPRRRQRLRGGLKLPVVTIQPQPLGWWARATAAVGEQQTTGIVLRADAFQLDKPADAMTETLTAKQLVERFRGTASEKAQELADMMAVLPVNWSVLRLIQKNLVRKSADALQETAALYLAEIFLSGLLRPVSIAAEPDQKLSTTQQYDFVEGVRNVLLGAIPISEAREVGEEIATTIFKQLPAEVQDRVNADITRRWGESLSYFEAFLMPDLPWGEDAAAEMLSFAQVTGNVLRRWGGKYAELAAELEQKRTPPEPVVIASKTELKTILLVEDEQKVIEDIREVLLSQYGITVRGTDDVNKVIEQAESSEIDLILINSILPGSRYKGRKVNGFEIVELLKSNLNISHDLPIVGFSLDYVEDEFLQYGADGFYSKRELFDSANFQKFVDYLQVVFNQVTQTKSSKPGKNYAIAIGINDYYYLASLKYAVRDAEAMCDWFRTEGRFQQVYLFTDNSPPITDAVDLFPSQPTCGKLRRFLQKRFEQPFLSAGDDFWFFFSGQGLRYRDVDYLMLTDSDPHSIEETAISVNYIKERLRQSGAGNILMFVDACRTQNSAK